MVNVRDSDIVVSEFESQSCCYVRFLTNTRGERYKLTYISNYGVK